MHVACCLAYFLSRLFKQFRHNESKYLYDSFLSFKFDMYIISLAQKRRVLAAAAAAGVSVAFGSPLGGVLFGLEGMIQFPTSVSLALLFFLELDTFGNESDVMWRGFVASAIAAVSLQWVNPFGTAKLVLFQVRMIRLCTVSSDSNCGKR